MKMMITPRPNIKASKQRINRRGFFHNVEISEKPVKNKPNYLDLEIEVEEKATGFFSIAGGYSSTETLLLGVQIQGSKSVWRRVAAKYFRNYWGINGANILR